MKERGPLHVPIVGEDSEPFGVINARVALPALLEGSEHLSRSCEIVSWELEITVMHDGQ